MGALDATGRISEEELFQRVVEITKFSRLTNAKNCMRSRQSPSVKTLNYWTDRQWHLPGLLTATVQIMHESLTRATGYTPLDNNISIKSIDQYINSIDLNKIFSHNEPTYLIGYLNTNQRNFGCNTNNLRGHQIVTLMDTDKCRHIGPFFDTKVSANSRGKPGIALTNNIAYLNTDLDWWHHPTTFQ